MTTVNVSPKCIMVHGQSSATQVGKKSDAGLKAHFAGRPLILFFGKRKRESRINLLRSVRKWEKGKTRN